MFHSLFRIDHICWRGFDSGCQQPSTSYGFGVLQIKWFSDQSLTRWFWASLENQLCVPSTCTEAHEQWGQCVRMWNRVNSSFSSIKASFGFVMLSYVTDLKEDDEIEFGADLPPTGHTLKCYVVFMLKNEYLLSSALTKLIWIKYFPLDLNIQHIFILWSTGTWIILTAYGWG